MPDDDRSRPTGRTTARIDEAVRRLDEVEGQLCEADRLNKVEKLAERNASQLRVARVIGGVILMLAAGTGTLAIQALRSSGFDAGEIRTTLRFLQRDADAAAAEIRALRDELINLRRSPP